MKKTRTGMDVRIVYAIHRANGEEDLSNASNLSVRIENVDNSIESLECSFELIDKNALSILIKGKDLTVTGKFRAVVKYTKHNPNRTPSAEPFVVDSLAFESVRFSNQVGGENSCPDISVTQISLSTTVDKYRGGEQGEKGDAFVYTDFTAENIIELQKPAAESVKTVLETNDNIIKSEKTRVDNFNKIVTDSAVVNKTLTDTNTDITKEELLRVESEKKRKLETDQAIANTNHMPYIENGTWWKFDIEQQKYVNTGDVATVQFATAEVDPVTGLLSFRYPEGFDELNFSINNGKLIITI